MLKGLVHSFLFINISLLVLASPLGQVFETSPADARVELSYPLDDPKPMCWGCNFTGANVNTYFRTDTALCDVFGLGYHYEGRQWIEDKYVCVGAPIPPGPIPPVYEYRSCRWGEWTQQCQDQSLEPTCPSQCAPLE